VWPGEVVTEIGETCGDHLVFHGIYIYRLYIYIYYIYIHCIYIYIHTVYIYTLYINMYVCIHVCKGHISWDLNGLRGGRLCQVDS
jgi:hypothetical protein